MKRRATWLVLVPPLAAAVVYAVLAASPGLWETALRSIFPDAGRVLYQGDSMLELVGRHLLMVGLSSVLSVVVGVGMGVFVTRPAGADFFDTVADLANFGQTFPPIAVFTLAVPVLGFGLRPTVLALTLYGVLPVLQNTIEALRAVPPSITESASGMGLTPLQTLLRVELPLGMPVIIAGIRVSVVINVATATLGAVAGAGGLGAPIISGLVNTDPAVTLQGALLTAGLALILDAMLGSVERLLSGTATA
jgi:osmoprotectant transport system permease protein